jgi:hypothetical protein
VKSWTAGTPDPDEGLRAFEHTVVKDQRTAKWTANIQRPADTHGYVCALDQQVVASDAAGRQDAGLAWHARGPEFESP